MTEEYKTKLERTRDNLKSAQLALQSAQTFIRAAKRFNALNPNERRLLERHDNGLYDPIDDIQCVLNNIKIALK